MILVLKLHYSQGLEHFDFMGTDSSTGSWEKKINVSDSVSV